MSVMSTDRSEREESAAQDKEGRGKGKREARVDIGFQANCEKLLVLFS